MTDNAQKAWLDYQHYAHGKTMYGGTLTSEGWVEHKPILTAVGSVLAPVLVTPDPTDPCALPRPVRDDAGRLRYASPYHPRV